MMQKVCISAWYGYTASCLFVYWYIYILEEESLEGR